MKRRLSKKEKGETLSRTKPKKVERGLAKLGEREIHEINKGNKKERLCQFIGNTPKEFRPLEEKVIGQQNK